MAGPFIYNMKKRKILIPVLVLCLAGIIVLLTGKAEHHPLPAVLSQADSLCDIDPRRAMRMLDSIAPEMEKENTYARNRHALLAIKARDKAFVPHTPQTLDSIRPVVEFYDAHGNSNERIEAYYYRGSVCRDLHDFPQTVRCYTKALEIAEDARESIDTLLVANVCSQLSFIFFKQDHFEKSLEYAKKEKDFLLAVGKYNARGIMDVASCYFLVEKEDSTFLYYEKAIEYMQRHNDFKGNMDILAEMFSNYAQFGDLSKADKCYALFDSLVHKDRLPSNYHIAKAVYFKSKNMPDSAIHYYKELFERSPEQDKKSDAARELLRLYSMAGNDAESLKYGQIYAELQDSVWKNLHLQQTADAYNEYRYYRNAEKEDAAYRKSTALWRRSLTVLSVAVISVLLIAYIYVIYRRKSSRAIERGKKELMRKDKALEDKDARLQKYDEIITQNRSLIESQKEEIKEAHDRNTRLARVRRQELFESDATNNIYIKFRKAAAGQYKPTERDWTTLYNVIAKEDPDFSAHIQKGITRINKKKIDICHLLKLGFTWIEVRNAMGIPRTTAFRLTKELTKQLEDLFDNPET